MAEKPKEDFEKEILEIKEVIQKLSDPEITLNESVKIYKSGIDKLKKATEMLEKAKLEISNHE